MKYLVRLDDACPTMHRDQWEKVLSTLDFYGVKPLIGVIPCCQDPKMTYMEAEDEDAFWNRVKEWQCKGYTIALHGYDHCYISACAGINPVNSKSEFAGVPIEEQKKKLRQGYNIMKEHGVVPRWFFAPSHTYDDNTLIALREETSIRMISDTIALKPYKKDEFTYYPVQSGHFFTPPLNGVWTFCLHPSIMSEQEILSVEQFIRDNQEKFDSFDSDDIKVQRRKSCVDKLLSYGYFTYRKLRAR